MSQNAETQNQTTATPGQPEAPPQPNSAPNAETKLKYQKIVPCVDCGQHGQVYLAWPDTGEQTSRDVQYFDDLESVYLMLDKDSAQRLKKDVSEHQAGGMLMDLVSPEVQAELKDQEQEHRQREEARQAMRRELHSRADKLDRRVIRKKVEGLSDQSLAAIVTNRLLEALDKPELNPVFDEMVDRDFVITITVEDNCGCQKVVGLNIDPRTLISHDVSNELADLEDEKKEFLKEALDKELDSY